MNTTLILIAVIVVISGLAYLGWARSVKLKDQIRRKDAKLLAMSKNLEAIRLADKDDNKAIVAVAKIDKEIVNAKTNADASRIRQRFVSGAYNGL